MSKVTFLLDLGVGNIKLGTADQKEPLLVFPTIYGYPRFSFENKDLPQVVFGHPVDEFAGSIDRRYVFTPTSAQNFEILKDFLRYSFHLLDLSTENEQLILSTNRFWSSDFLFRLQTFLFQEFNFSSMLVQPSESFVIDYFQIPDAVVIDSGFYSTRIFFYQNGKPLTNSFLSSNSGAQTINDYLQELFSRKSPFMKSTMVMGYINMIKETKCYVSLDLDKDLADREWKTLFQETMHIAPLHQDFTFDVEKILGPEILFKPMLAGREDLGFMELLVQALKECHPNLRKQIFSTIIFSGGSVGFPHFIERIHLECEKIPLLRQAQLKISEKPLYTTWWGMKSVVDREKYQENAVSQTKFFAFL